MLADRVNQFMSGALKSPNKMTSFVNCMHNIIMPIAFVDSLILSIYN